MVGAKHLLPFVLNYGIYSEHEKQSKMCKFLQYDFQDFPILLYIN